MDQAISITKDLILFTIGAGLIIHQGFVVPRQDFNWIILAGGGVLAGVPGWLQLWGLRSMSIGGQPSQPVAEPSLPPSSSSSSG